MRNNKSRVRALDKFADVLIRLELCEYIKYVHYGDFLKRCKKIRKNKYRGHK